MGTTVYCIFLQVGECRSALSVPISAPSMPLHVQHNSPSWCSPNCRLLRHSEPPIVNTTFGSDVFAPSAPQLRPTSVGLLANASFVHWSSSCPILPLFSLPFISLAAEARHFTVRSLSYYPSTELPLLAPSRKPP